MPFVKVDPESFDEYAEDAGLDPSQRPSGVFEYEPTLFPDGATTFDPTTLGGAAGAMSAALRSLGAARFRVRYDGGYDEGFAHADAIFLADGTGRPIEQVEPELAAAAGAIRAAVIADPKAAVYGNAAKMYAAADDAQVVRYALTELAYTIASTLLGNSFGTGEYALYGALTADLSTGEIADDPAAPRPPEMED